MSKNDDLVRRLRSCPFCGGEASMRSGGPGCHFVQCDTCNATSDDHSMERAVEKWNRRHPDAIERGAGIYSGPGEVSFTLSIGRNCTVDMGGMGFDAPLNDAVVTVRPRSHTFTAPPPAPQAADTRPGAANGSLRGERQALATPPAPAPDAGEEHPEDHCRCCGQSNPVWSAPNDLWNRVMGGSAGILCPRCFIDRAEMAGAAPKIWRIGPTPQPSATATWWVAERDDIYHPKVFMSEDAAQRWQERVTINPPVRVHAAIRVSDHEAALKAKTDEIERLRRECDHWLGQARSNLKAGQDCLEKLEAAEASNKALRKGLEPFADAASVVPGLRDEDECGVAGSYPPEGFKGRITVGDLRRARALLSETGGTDGAS